MRLWDYQIIRLLIKNQLKLEDNKDYSKEDTMAKVILLNGSPRKNSNTLMVLKECAKAIEAEGVETEIISLKDKT